MVINKKYCSYFPALVKAFERVSGNVLELGAGLQSTFFLHWMCMYQGRKLVTYEKNKEFYDLVKHCRSEFHEVVLVEDWNEIFVEKDWGIVLVDHDAERRKYEITRLAKFASCLVVHDTDWRNRRHYQFEEVLSLFQYHCTYGKGFKPGTKLLSNFFDVTLW